MNNHSIEKYYDSSVKHDLENLKKFVLSSWILWSNKAVKQLWIELANSKSQQKHNIYRWTQHNNRKINKIFFSTPHVVFNLTLNPLFFGYQKSSLPAPIEANWAGQILNLKWGFKQEVWDGLVFLLYNG